MLISGPPQGNRTALQRPVSWGQEVRCLVCICRQASCFGKWGAQVKVKHTSMDNEEAMETNYFTTSESQDSGTKFLLPLLLFWNIIDVTAQSEQSPTEHGENQRSDLHCFKPLIKIPKKTQNSLDNVSPDSHSLPNWEQHQSFASPQPFSIDFAKPTLT